MGAGTHSCVGSAPRWSVDPPACAPPSARTSPRTMSIVGSSLPATRPARTGPAPTAGNAVLARPRVNGRGAADAGQRSPMGRAVVVPLGASMGRGLALRSASCIFRRTTKNAGPAFTVVPRPRSLHRSVAG